MQQKTKCAGGMRLTTGLQESRCGTPEPTLRLDAPRGTPHRVVSACLHRIAAAIEDACAPEDRWIVQIESGELWGGRVYLELADGTAAEAERGMAVLAKVEKAAR